MKEKLKKIFYNKNFCCVVLETICAITLVLVGYLSGFANGLFIEDDIRDNMILEINDLIDENHKNEKLDIKIDKKENVDLPYTYNYTYQNLTMPFLLQIIEEDSLVAGQGFISFDLSFDFLIYSSDNIVVNNIYMLNFEIGFAEYSFNGIDSNFTYYIPTFNYNSPIELMKVDNELFSFSIEDNLNFSFPYFYIDNYTDYYFYIDFFINDNVFTSYFNQTFLNQLISTIGTDYIIYFVFAYDKNVSKPYPTYSLNSSLNTLFAEIFAQENGGASQEDLEQAYQDGINVGYQSGVIEGANEYKSSQEYFDTLENEYNKGLEEGKEIGYQNRVDSVEDTQQRINNIWDILENAITSALNVLSMEILPGMPLFICVVVPVLLALILWVVKMGGS